MKVYSKSHLLCLIRDLKKTYSVSTSRFFNVMSGQYDGGVFRLGQMNEILPHASEIGIMAKARSIPYDFCKQIGGCIKLQKMAIHVCFTHRSFKTGSIPTVGSSRMTNRGRCMSEIANDILRPWPPLHEKPTKHMRSVRVRCSHILCLNSKCEYLNWVINLFFVGNFNRF